MSQIITTPGGEELVILSLVEFEHLSEAAEDAIDAAVIKSRSGEPTLPLELASRVISGELHPLVAWRTHLGLSQAALAEKAGVRQATIADIETAKGAGRVDTMQRIAKVLGLGLDDIVAEINE